MIVLPIYNRDRILNVNVELKNKVKVATKTTNFNIGPSDVAVNGYRFSDSHLSKTIATPKTIMEFIRLNLKTGRGNIVISTKEEDGLYDLYQINNIGDKVSDGVDNLIGTLILALKNESSTQKGRYLDLEKIGLFDIITLERIKALEFLNKNMNKVNITKYIEDNDLRCVFNLLKAMSEFDFTVLKNSKLPEEKYIEFMSFLEPTKSRDYINLKNYFTLAKNNQRQYSKISYLNKIVNNKPLQLIHSSHEKVKVYQENKNEAA